MTTVNYAAAVTIQKLWRGHIFAKALPHAIAQVRSMKDIEKKIQGPRWGDPPQDWELEGNRWGFSDCPSDEEQPFYSDDESQVEGPDWDNYDDYLNERLYYFH
jgi:hypothetical protein|tara:strand:+ start:731 stop:1039 length:309 start_codon:yes stop_codon:yes gene_type:complete